jgi:hypothetical protein
MCYGRTYIYLYSGLARAKRRNLILLAELASI